ncbi:autotransporter outer membrane beta-barrel domain-containing protein [Veillonella sp. R32]|uniref:autotransporter family protein n=1 Tax=Veillonella sp. R32 TaxID=2021312 RepID=UPI0013896D15|nr:autotransporter outer membrane beta-barrel domain-containing protein [Veillonella sp. R32]
MFKSKASKKHLQLKKKVMLALMAVSLTGGVYFSIGQPVLAADAVDKVTTISSGTYYGVVGGEKLNLTGNEKQWVKTPENPTVAISGGALTNKESNSNVELSRSIIGGHYLIANDKFTGFGQSDTEDVILSISGGEFTAPIFAGSVAQRTGEYVATGKLDVADTTTNLTLTGGEFKDIFVTPEAEEANDNYSYNTNLIFGGGAAIGGNTFATVDKVNIVIDNPEGFKEFTEVYGGGFAQAGGHSEVLESTITVKSGENFNIIAGGYAIAGPLTVPDKNNLANSVDIEDSFRNIKDVIGVETQSHIENSTINIYGGVINYLRLGGDTETSGGAYSSVNKNLIDNVVVNYYDGTIKSITMPFGAKKSTINLYKDLSLKADELHTLEIFNNKYYENQGIGESSLTVDGQNKYSLNATVAVNYDLDSDGDDSTDKPEYYGSARLNLNSLNNFNGKIVTYDKGIVIIDGVKSIKGDLEAKDGGLIELANVESLEGRLLGAGDINLESDLTLSDKLVFEGTDIAFTGGNYTGTYNLKNEDTTVWIEGGAKVHVADFDKNIIGKGKLQLGDKGTLITTATQLFGNNADDTTITVNGDKVFPIDVKSNVREKVDILSGTIELLTDKYSLAYADKALEAIHNSDYSYTKLAFSGNLIDKGLTLSKVKEQQNNNLIVNYDNATIEIDGNPNLVISGNIDLGLINADGISATESSNNKAGFSAAAVNLAANSKGIVIAGAESLMLGGKDGGEVVLVDGKADKNIKVIVGLEDINNSPAELLLGNNSADEDTKITLTGQVQVNNDSVLEIGSDVTVSEGVVLNNGSIEVLGGQLNSDISVKGNQSTLIGKAIGNLTLTDEDSQFTVGSKEQNAIAKFTNVSLNGGSLILDPTWSAAANEVSVDFAKADANENVIDGKLLVGQNTYATIGDSNDAKSMFQKTGLTFGEDDITAALYIKGNQSLGSDGAILVDGAMQDADLVKAASSLVAGTFNVADHSITMVDGSATEAKAALSGVQKVAIGDSAKLYVDDAVAGKTYHILINDGKTAISDVDEAGWLDSANILTNKRLIKLTGVLADDATTLDVVAESNSVKDVYGNKLVIGDVIDGAFLADKDTRAYELVSAIADDKVNITEAKQIDAFNSLGNLTALSGATHATYSVSGITHDAITNHMSLANNLTHDKDVWAQLIHTKDSVSDLTSGGMDADYDNKLNGVVVGADFYHKAGKTLGAAFTYAKGDIDGRTLATSTSTDSKFYGLSVYGGIEKETYALIGDISYLSGNNDVTQYNSGKRVEGSPDTKAFSIGVRAEKRIAQGENATLVPYVGARYLHLQTDDYITNYGFSYDQSNKNMLLVPLGIKYSANYKHGNWNILPVAELGYIWNSGRSVDQMVSFGDVTNGFTYDLTDRGSFIGKLGVEATKGDVTYSVGYEYQKGSSVKSNRFRGGVNVKF